MTITASAIRQSRAAVLEVSTEARKEMTCTQHPRRQHDDVSVLLRALPRR